MKTGDIVLLPFPFAELSDVKVRPGVIVTITKDIYKDIVICAISSIVPAALSDNEFVIQAGGENSLRVTSVIKIDRIVTLKSKNVIAQLGKLNHDELNIFKSKFKLLVE